MKSKFNLLLAIILFYGGTLFGQVYNKQNTYLDALELANIMDSFNSMPNNTWDTMYKIDSFYDAFYKIMYKYGSDVELQENPFFYDNEFVNPLQYSLNNPDLVSMQIGYSSLGIASISPSSFTPTSWQAATINGAASFMAGRFKQELLHVAINSMFRQIMTSDDSILIKCIYPKTFKHIDLLYGTGKSSYYTADLLLLRQTAQMDIEQLPRNIVKNAEALIPLLTNDPQLKDMLSLGNYLIKYSQQGQSPASLLSTLSDEIYSSDSSVFKMLNLADLVSQALLSPEGSEGIWVNPLITLPATSKDLENLEIKYFYGLLYQQLIQIPELRSYLEYQENNDVELIAAKIQKLILFVNQLNNSYDYLKSKDFKLSSEEEFIYIKEVDRIVGFFTNTLLNDEIVHLSDTMFNVSLKYITIVEGLKNKEYQDLIPYFALEFGEIINMSAKSLRAITFVSQLATIESAEDMEALLSAYSLPIGSSSIKRNSSFNVSVNGYVGLTGGWETAYGTLDNQVKGNIGLSAPIGISATFCNGYLSPFVSFIDLGSIVNQRLNNDTTSYSDLKLEHFFIPGIGLLLNAPKLPISAGLHFSYIPNLRTIQYESGNTTIIESDISVTRINFSLLVDIPFFTIYNEEE